MVTVHIDSQIDYMHAKTSNYGSENMIISSMSLRELKAMHLLKRSLFVFGSHNELSLTVNAC